MSIQDIALNKLTLSPKNVRPKPPCDSGIAQLAANIAAHGLQQNLIVVPKNKRAGTFYVIAGGRRLAALQSLAKDKHIPTDTPISCRVESDKSKASELSLAENELRLNMSVTETCTAFKALIDGGKSFEDIAKSFGVTVRFVKQRIALASLSAPVFEALEAGEITLDVAQVFANCPDQDRQAQVFNDNPWNLSHAVFIKRQLQNTAAPGSSRFARYVGEADYIAAGGVVTKQLFEEDTLFEDAAKLEQIAMEKLGKEVAGEAAKRGIAEVVAFPDSYTPYDLDGYVRLNPQNRDATDEEAEHIDALETQLEALHGQGDAEDLSDDDYNALQSQIDDLESELKDARAALLVIPDDLKSQAIAPAIITTSGKVEVADALFIPKALAKAANGQGHSAVDGAEACAPATPESAKLLDELAEHRALILAAGLAQAPDLAQDLGRYEIIVSVLSTLITPHAFALKTGPIDSRAPVDLSGTIAARSLRASLEQLNAAWLEGDTYDGMFSAFCDLPEAEKVAWFAFAVAQTVQPVLADHSGTYGSADQMQAHLFAPLGMDEQDWWRPTVQNYFGRVKKARCLEIAEEIGGPSLKGQLSGLKKGDIAQALEDICAGKGHLSGDTRQTALKWMPEPMRFAVPSDVTKSTFGAALRVRGLGQTPVDACEEDDHASALADLPETQIDDDWEEAIETGAELHGTAA